MTAAAEQPPAPAQPSDAAESSDTAQSLNTPQSLNTAQPLAADAPETAGDGPPIGPGDVSEVDAPTPAPPVPQWNIANILTVARLALVPVFLVLFLHAGGRETVWRLGAAVVFMIASYTDRLDGQLARQRGLITDFGKIADPIADKALMGSALVALSAQDRLWWWVTAVILVRFWVIRYGVIAASRGGKLKTLLQGLSIWIFVLPLGAIPGLSWLTWVSDVIMAAALGVTVVTGVDYVVKAIQLRRAAPAQRTAAESGADRVAP